MSIVVKDIDFISETISLEINSSPSVERYERLREYLSYCCGLGFSKSNIFRPQSMSAGDLALLKRLEKENDVSIITSESTEELQQESLANRSVQFRHYKTRVHGTGHSDRIEYGIHFFDLHNVLDYLTSFVLLIGGSIPLEDRVLSRLRLCIYELAANSVDHAEFIRPLTRIEVRLLMCDKLIEVTYKDNATVFQATNRQKVDIAQIIETKRRRGLGLFVLEKLASDLSCKRDGKWNCTTFTIKCQDDDPSHSEGG